MERELGFSARALQLLHYAGHRRREPPDEDFENSSTVLSYLIDNLLIT